MSVLTVDQVSIGFGGVVALDDVTLEIPPAEIRGIIGPNGAGKTTLLNVICGINRPDRGDVRLDGASLIGLKPSRIAAKGLGRTFQTARLFRGLTVLENMMVGLHLETRSGLFGAAFSSRAMRAEERELAERARRSLEFVGFAHLAELPGAALSFGQSRIVEIARTLIHEPKVVLLDEPAVGLSLNRSAELDRLLRRIRDERGVTLVMIEHVIRLVMEVSDRVTVLSYGRNIAEGRPADIRENPEVITAYLGRALDARRAAS
ncbi:MAG: ABC transporter ATP-binding protein [Proteobacteria bacterium]|nr:ABC transporter ATP-binding protein [Pseudomonadota bacterium]